MKKYKIVNKQRFYLFISIIFILILTTVFLFINLNGAHSIILNEEYKEVHILEGDTLWNIARKNMSNEYDTRYLVYKIKEFNDLDTAHLYPGDIIKIPNLD